jgi:Tfp pilus assembly protein PilF
LIDYTRATECDPLFTLGLENRARLHSRQGNRQAALQDLHAVKHRDPLTVNPYHCICRMYCEVGQTELAMEELRSALLINVNGEFIDTRFQVAVA